MFALFSLYSFFMLCDITLVDQLKKRLHIKNGNTNQRSEKDELKAIMCFHVVCYFVVVGLCNF